MGKATLEKTDLDQQLESYLKLPYNVSRFLSSQEREAHRFEQFFHEETGEMIMRFQPGATAEGPPGHCHGGFIASMLDECMGGVAWWQTYVVLAGNLNIRYRKPVPLHQTYYIHGTVSRAEKRRVYCTGKLCNTDGVILAQGTGMFVRLPWDKFPEDKDGHFEITNRYVRMRESGMPMRECIAILEQEQAKLTPPA